MTSAPRRRVLVATLGFALLEFRGPGPVVITWLHRWLDSVLLEDQTNDERIRRRSSRAAADRN